ncbi:MAG: hypothetical protein IPH31_05415 [Lewinellaceae bacterium]|nr:hypothetical protein [Lewinellaceae bacterium]
MDKAIYSQLLRANAPDFGRSLDLPFSFVLLDIFPSGWHGKVGQNAAPDCPTNSGRSSLFDFLTGYGAVLLDVDRVWPAFYAIRKLAAQRLATALPLLGALLLTALVYW